MVAMAALDATLQTIQDEHLMDRAPAIFAQIRDGLDGLVVDVRGRGCLIGVELDGPARPVLAALHEAGVLAGSAGHPNVIRLMPPLNTPGEAIDAFLEAFHEGACAAHGCFRLVGLRFHLVWTFDERCNLRPPHSSFLPFVLSSVPKPCPTFSTGTF